MTANSQIINKAGETTITTEGLHNGGYLNPEQARQFLQQTFDATPLMGLVRHEIRTAKTGEIDKIGIASRLLRKKVENTDDGYRAGVEHSRLEYSCVNVRVPWEITEETLRENIEGENYENIVTNLMTTQIGVDTEDIHLNGDTEVDESDPDHDFLYLNDGWIKQLKDGAHVVDKSDADVKLNMDTFYDALQVMPNKYNDGTLRWLMSPHRKQEWERYILNQAVTAGGIITDNRVENPAAIPLVQVPKMPDDCIILINPQNLITVNTYDMKIRMTTEGESAIMQDKRFYVVHFDFDSIIEELDAGVIITGLGEI